LGLLLSEAYLIRGGAGATVMMATCQPRVSLTNAGIPQRLILPVNVRDRMQLLLFPSKPLREIGLLSLSSSAVGKVSANLLTTIYNTLQHPRDQIAFALTCHGFATIATSSYARPLQAGISTTHRNTIVSYTKEHLVADLVTWAFITPKSKHAPLKLCRSCWKYLPRNRIWRTRDSRRELRSLKRVDWAWAVMLWAKGGGKICPTCQIPVGYDDEVKGQFLQRAGVGLGTHKMVVQTYEEELESD
jgi:hypothetical protein